MLVLNFLGSLMALYAVLVLQQALAALWIWTGEPRLTVAALMCGAAHGGRKWVLLAGLCGLCEDALAGPPLGLGLVLYALAAWLAQCAATSNRLRRPWGCALLTTVLTTLMLVAHAAGRDPGLTSWWPLVCDSAASGAWTGGAALLISGVAHRVRHRESRVPSEMPRVQNRWSMLTE